MQHKEFQPPGQLRDSIKCFWYNNNDFGEQSTNFEVVPDGYAEIIFYFGNTCSIVQNGVAKLLPSPFMIGLLNQTAVFNTAGRLQIIAIRCYPWTVFALLGLQPNKDGVHTFQHPIAALHPTLAKCVDEGRVDEAINHVAQYFLDAHLQTTGNNMLAKAGGAMNDAKGTIPVSQVAAAAHATVRTLERQFKQSSGHTVKDVSGLMRFEQVRNHLWHHPDCNLAGLAADLGYTDQAHLTREFKRYTNTTPAAFARHAKQQSLTIIDYVAFTQT